MLGEGFQAQSETTHGIEVRDLPLAHPTEAGVEMALRCWDFGGQQIYHATHQFFLTGRALFLVCWNARLGFEQGKLEYWLDATHSLAPGAPVAIVATHTDQRDAKLPLEGLQRRYPQVVGAFAVSNLTTHGIDELREAIRRHAAELPLMGSAWPSTWLAAAEAVRDLDRLQIRSGELLDVFAEHGVREPTAQQTLARWLHDLGDITWFDDDAELKDTVLLDPEWVSNRVSDVLECGRIIDGLGGQEGPGRAGGTALLRLRRLLDEEAPRWQATCKLRKVLTPENHYLWPCEAHAAEYLV